MASRHPNSDVQSWWVRTERGLLGPLTGAELRRRSAASQVLPYHLVSVDCTRWHRAETIHGLSFGAAEDPPSSSFDSGRNKR